MTQSKLLGLSLLIPIASMLASCNGSTLPEQAGSRSQTTYCEIVERIGGPVHFYPGDSKAEKIEKLKHAAAYECACLGNCPVKSKP
jgi:hypothetical protein